MTILNLVRRTPALILLCIALASACLSGLGAFFRWAAIIGGVLSALAAVAQYLSRGAYVVAFTEADWQGSGDDLILPLGNNHQKGRAPVVSVYMPTDEGDGMQEIGIAVHTDAKGAVTLCAALRFAGEARIS